MLKRFLKDERGSAFVLAILVMLVTVIITSSFMNSVSTATKLESNATKVDEAYLMAKSGMIYFEQMVKKNGWTKAEVIAKFNNPVKGYVDYVPAGERNAKYFEIQTKTRASADEYNIICTGHYGGAAYKLYKFALTDSAGGPGPGPTESLKKASLVDYTNGSYDASLRNGFEGSYYILNDEPGGSLEITNAGGQDGKMKFGKLVTVTDVTIRASTGMNFGESTDAEAGIYSKGNFQYFNDGINIPGVLFLNAMDARPGTSGKNLTVDQAIHVATDMYDGTQGGDNREYKGNVFVAGDCTLIMDNCTVTIGGNLVVGGNLNLSFSGGGKLIMSGEGQNDPEADNWGLSETGKIIVKGDVTITGADGNSITMPGGSKVIYIKNGVLTAGSSGITSSWDTAYSVLFSNGTEVPDYKMYKKISKEIDSKFPPSDRPETRLPANFTDTSLPNQPLVITSITQLPSKKVIDVDGVEKTLYIASQDCIFDCDINTELGSGHVDRILMFQTSSNPTRDSDGKTTSSDNAIDAYFKQGLSFGHAYNNNDSDQGGKIWIDDDGHNGCVRFFLADGYAPQVMTNRKWGVEGVTNPKAFGIDPDDSSSVCEKRFLKMTYGGTDGKETERYIDYDYVPNLYVFSLTSTIGGASTGSLIMSSGSDKCFPAYILTPYLNYNFSGNPVGFDSTKSPDSIHMTYDNAAKVHGMLNSNRTEIIDGKGVFVKGVDPDEEATRSDVCSVQSWYYNDAIYDVYGYFKSSGEYSYSPE